MVQKLSFKERYVDGADRLCTTVTAVREEEKTFSKSTQTAMNVWAEFTGFMALFSAIVRWIWGLRLPSVSSRRVCGR